MTELQMHAPIWFQISPIIYMYGIYVGIKAYESISESTFDEKRLRVNFTEQMQTKLETILHSSP